MSLHVVKYLKLSCIILEKQSFTFNLSTMINVFKKKIVMYLGSDFYFIFIYFALVVVF